MVEKIVELRRNIPNKSPLAKVMRKKNLYVSRKLTILLLPILPQITLGKNSVFPL